MSTSRTVTVAAVKRRLNTRSGNPQWAIATEEGSMFRTSPDTHVAFEVSEDLVGQRVEITISDAGYLVAIREEQPS